MYLWIRWFSFDNRIPLMIGELTYDSPMINNTLGILNIISWWSSASRAWRASLTGKRVGKCSPALRVPGPSMVDWFVSGPFGTLHISSMLHISSYIYEAARLRGRIDRFSSIYVTFSVDKFLVSKSILSSRNWCCTLVMISTVNLKLLMR